MMQILEKILQEIEERINEMTSEARECEEMEEYTEAEVIDHTISGLNIASNIIRSHMGDDAWIPVKEKLPEVPEGTEDAYCPEFNVTIKGFSEPTTLKYSWDGTWFDDSGNLYNVSAWQPLPEPYKTEERWCSRMYRVKISTYDHFTGGLCVRYKNFRCRSAARLYIAIIRAFGVTAAWGGKRRE